MTAGLVGAGILGNEAKDPTALHQGGDDFGADIVAGDKATHNVVFISHNRRAATFLLPADAASPLATAGQLGLPKRFQIMARNAADSLDINVLNVDLTGGPAVTYGDASIAIDYVHVCNANGQIRFVAGGGETFVSHFADFGAKAQIKAPIDYGVILARTAGAAGSAGYGITFQCQTVAGTRGIRVFAHPFGAVNDEYGLFFANTAGVEMVYLDDISAIYGGTIGQLSCIHGTILSSEAIVSVSGGEWRYGVTIAAGATLDMSADNILVLNNPSVVSSKIMCKPAVGSGCVVKLPSAFWGFRFMIGDYSGNAAAGNISIYTKTGETINGVVYDVAGGAPYLIAAAWGQVTIIADENSTNWIIQCKAP